MTKNKHHKKGTKKRRKKIINSKIHLIIWKYYDPKTSFLLDYITFTPTINKFLPYIFTAESRTLAPSLTTIDTKILKMVQRNRYMWLSLSWKNINWKSKKGTLPLSIYYFHLLVQCFHEWSWSSKENHWWPDREGPQHIYI